MASESLTPKQHAFVEAYLETGNATEAYRRSYNASSMSEMAINVEAHRLVNNPKVALRLQELQRQAAAVAVLSRSWVLDRLMRNADEAIKATDFTASNKALELLGKTDEIGGMFTEKSVVQSTTTNTTTLTVSRYDEALAQFHGERASGDTEGSVPN